MNRQIVKKVHSNSWRFELALPELGGRGHGKMLNYWRRRGQSPRTMMRTRGIIKFWGHGHHLFFKGLGWSFWTSRLWKLVKFGMLIGWYACCMLTSLLPIVIHLESPNENDQVEHEYLTWLSGHYWTVVYADSGILIQITLKLARILLVDFL